MSELSEEARMIRSLNGKLVQAMKGLRTEKQRQFVLRYNEIDDKKQAYRDVYKSVSWQTGYAKLMQNPTIKECLEIIDSRAIEQNEIKKEEILLQLYYAVVRSADDLLDDNGLLVKNMKNLPERVKACIDSIEQEEFYDEEGNLGRVKTKVKLMPKAKALEMAMKHKGLFAPEQHQHKVVVDFGKLPVSDEDVDPVQQRIDAEYKRSEDTPTQ